MSDTNKISNLTQINVAQLTEAVGLSVRAGRTLMIHGSPGVGKSAGILAAARVEAQRRGLSRVVQLGEVGPRPENEFGFFDVRLTNMGPEEFGLPHADPVRQVQTRLPVDWFPSTDRDDLPDYGILAFEELTSVSPAMQAAVYQIAHDRRLGDKVLKPGWSVVGTGNRMSDGGVVFRMATPLANRMYHVYVRSDVDQWCLWALENDVLPEVVGFIRFRPDLLNTFEEYIKNRTDEHAFATERSWEAASDLLRGANGQSGAALSAMLAGGIGRGPSIEFEAFRSVWKSMPSIDGIIVDPINAPVPDDSASRYAVSSALAHRATPDNLRSIAQYIERLPSEFAMMVMRDAARRKRELMSTPEWVRFAAANHELIIG